VGLFILNARPTQVTLVPSADAASAERATRSWRRRAVSPATDERPQKCRPVEAAASLVIAPNHLCGGLLVPPARFNQEPKHGFGQLPQWDSPAPPEARLAPFGESEKTVKRRTLVPQKRG